MRLLVATTNTGKLREIRSLLAGVPVELVTLRDLAAIEEPEETELTFEENARLKALYYSGHTGMTDGRGGFGTGHRWPGRRARCSFGQVPSTRRDLPGTLRGDFLPARGAT
jgi:hypothetical protein